MFRKLKESEKSDALSAVPLFAGCTREELARMGNLATQVAVTGGQVLCTTGEVGLEFFVLLDGSARIERADGVVVEVGPGDFFGELALLLDGAPRTATVTVTSPGQVLVMSGPELRQLLRTVPEIAIRMLSVLGARLHEASTAG